MRSFREGMVSWQQQWWSASRSRLIGKFRVHPTSFRLQLTVVGGGGRNRGSVVNRALIWKTNLTWPAWLFAQERFRPLSRRSRSRSRNHSRSSSSYVPRGRTRNFLCPFRPIRSFYSLVLFVRSIRSFVLFVLFVRTFVGSFVCSVSPLRDSLYK